MEKDASIENFTLKVENGEVMLLFIMLFVIWLMLLAVFARTGNRFFLFLFGSVGLFGFCMALGLNSVERYLEVTVTWTVGALGGITGFFKGFPAYSMITVFHGPQAISFFVDYECSGFIETLVYVCLLAFYPLYGSIEKVLYGAVGVAYILAANVLRVFFICLVTRFFGSGLFFLSHTILARILFFFLMIVIYYRVFTRPHILRQKVGGMSYGN